MAAGRGGGDLQFAIRLTAEGSGFVGTVKVAKEEVTQLGRQSREAGGGIDSMEESMTRAVTRGNLLADAIKKGAEVLFNFMRGSIEAGDRLNDLSIGTGKTIEDLQALGIVADKNGGSLDTMRAAVDFVAKGMSKGGDEANKFKRAIDYFGVSMLDANGKLKDAEVLASEVAIAYTHTEKNASTLAAAQFALGSNYEKQIPQLIALGSKQDELNKLRQFGAIIDEDLARKSDEFNDTMRDAKSVMEGIGATMARILLPLLTSMAQWFVESATNGGILNGVIKVLEGTLVVFAATIKSVLTVFITLDAGVQIFGKTMSAVEEIVHGFISRLKGEGGADAKTIWNKLKTDIDEVGKTARGNIAAMWEMKGAVSDLDDFKPTGLLSGNGPFNSGRTHKIKEQKDAIADYTGEIARLENAQQTAINAINGVTSSTRHYDEAIIKITEDMLAGKVIEQDQLEARLAAARGLDQLEAALKQYNETLKAEIELAQAEQRAIDQHKDGLKREYDALLQRIAGMKQENEQLRAEYDMVGLTTEAAIHRNAEIERETILRTTAAGPERDRLIFLSKENEQLRLNTAAAQQNVDANRNALNDMQQGIAGFLRDVVEGGFTNAWRNAWKRIASYGLEVLAQWAARQVVVSFVGNAAGGAGGVASGLGGLLGGGGGGGGLGGLTSIISGVAGSFSSLGTAASIFAGSMADGLGVMASLNAGAASLGVTLASAVPVVGAFIAAAYLIYQFVKSKEGGPKTGGFATTGATPGITGVDSNGRYFTPNDQDAAVLKGLTAVNTQYSQILKALGGKASGITFAGGFDMDPQGKAPSNVHTTTFGPGGVVLDQKNPNVGRGTEDIQKELSTQAQRAILAALQASDLPKIVHDYLASIDATTASVDEIQAALTKAAGISDLAKTLGLKLPQAVRDYLEAIDVQASDSDEIRAAIQHATEMAPIAAALEGKLPEAVRRYLEQIDLVSASSDEIKHAMQHADELNQIVELIAAVPRAMRQKLSDSLGVSDELDARIAAFAEAFAAFAEASKGLQDQLDRDPNAEALAAVADAHASMYTRALRSRDALRDALAAFDGTTEGVQELTQATQDYIDAQRDALIEIQNMKAGLHDMFADSARALDLALMTDDEQKQFLIDEALAAQRALASATDPGEIDRLSRIINEDLMAAFRLMSPEEQQAQHDYLRHILEAANATAQAQLNAANAAINTANQSAQQLMTNVQNALNTATQKQLDAAQILVNAANEMKEAARLANEASDKQNTAADTNLEAAKTPVVIDPIQVEVTLRDLTPALVNG